MMDGFYDASQFYTATGQLNNYGNGKSERQRKHSTSNSDVGGKLRLNAKR